MSFKDFFVRPLIFFGDRVVNERLSQNAGGGGGVETEEGGKPHKGHHSHTGGFGPPFIWHVFPCPSGFFCSVFAFFRNPKVSRPEAIWEGVQNALQEECALWYVSSPPYVCAPHHDMTQNILPILARSPVCAGDIVHHPSTNRLEKTGHACAQIGLLSSSAKSSDNLQDPESMKRGRCVDHLRAS